MITIKSCGAVLFTDVNGERHYVLVSSVNNANVFGLPKGQMEKGETEQETASREILEETSVVAFPVKMDCLSPILTGNAFL